MMEAGDDVVVNWLNLVYKWKLSLLNNCVSYLNNIGISDGNGKCLCVPVLR